MFDDEKARETPTAIPGVDRLPTSLFAACDERERPAAEKIGYSSVKFALELGVLGAAGWFVLAITFPLVWGILNALLLLVGLGLMTTKVLLRLEQPAQIWCWTPFFGSVWLLLFWLIYVLTR